VGKGTVDEVFRNPTEGVRADADIDAEEARAEMYTVLSNREDLVVEEEECSDNSNRD
jgi:hypothetical protein